MTGSEQTLRAADGTPLFIADWRQTSSHQVRGVVIMHGLGEHCARHTHLARFFNECGWQVRAYDHRGHGRSGGPRGDVPDAQAIVRDAQLVIDDFAQRLGAPPLLFGHSMGGLFAARIATSTLTPLRGLILSSPALAISLTPPQRALLTILSRIAPGLGVSNGLQSRYLSHDPAIAPAYDADALVHRKISARLLNSMLEAIAYSHTHAATLAIPTLLVVAGADRLVDATGSQAFFAKLSPGLATMHRYEGFYHEIFHEIDAARVFDDVRAWLNTAIDAATGEPTPHTHSRP